MIQLRPGDLIGVRKDGAYVVFAVLTKQILFGGHWSFVYHRSRTQPPISGETVSGSGFNAVVDFIVPKREGRVVRISRGNNFSSLMGPELLQQPPLKGEENYHISRWKDGEREIAEFVRFTPSPSQAEKFAPHYRCVPGDFAWDLSERRWTENTPLWI